MEQAIEHGADRGGVAEQLPPVVDGTIRRDERRHPFISAHDDLEEIFGGGVRKLPHPEVIDDQERHGGELRERVLAPAGELRLGEILEQDMGLAIEHAVALLDGGEADRLSEVALPGAGRNSNILRSFRARSSSTTAGIRSSDGR